MSTEKHVLVLVLAAPLEELFRFHVDVDETRIRFRPTVPLRGHYDCTKGSLRVPEGSLMVLSIQKEPVAGFNLLDVERSE